jgi:hypothetical protein
MRFRRVNCVWPETSNGLRTQLAYKVKNLREIRTAAALRGQKSMRVAHA